MLKRKREIQYSNPKNKKQRYNNTILVHDIIFEIFKFLSFKDEYNFARVNRTFWKLYEIKYTKNINMTKIWCNIFSFMDYKDYSKFNTLNFAAHKAFRKRVKIRRSINCKTDILRSIRRSDMSICIPEKVTRKMVTLKTEKGKYVYKKICYEKHLPYIKMDSKNFYKKKKTIHRDIGKEECQICGKLDYLSYGYISTLKCNCEKDYLAYVKAEYDDSYSDINVLKYHYHSNVCVNCLVESIKL